MCILRNGIACIHCSLPDVLILPVRSLELRDRVTPPLAAHLPLALPTRQLLLSWVVISLAIPLSLAPLTSVMYPAVPSIAGTSITYANESQAVRRVQWKYLWRLVVMSTPCQPAVPQSPSRPSGFPHLPSLSYAIFPFNVSDACERSRVEV